MDTYAICMDTRFEIVIHHPYKLLSITPIQKERKKRKKRKKDCDLVVR